MIDVGQKKEKIISFIKDNGPSLPVRIAKTIEMEPVFASAILSELLNEKRIKMSNLRVGSSSLYLLQGQEKMLEDFADNLKSVEKEAFLKLKEKYDSSKQGLVPLDVIDFLISIYAKNPKGVEFASQTWTKPFLDITKFLINYYEVPPDR